MSWYDELRGAASWAWENLPGPGGITTEFMGHARDEAANATDELGLTNVEEQQEAYDQAEEALKQQQQQAGQTYNTALDLVAQNRGAIAEMIGPENLDYYKQMVYGIDPSKFAASTEPIKDFKFERDVFKYMDPAAKYQIDQSVNAALHAMTGQGGISGGAAARALRAEASQKASELYGDAWDRMMKASEQEYGKARDIVSAEQTAKQQEAAMKQYKTGQLGDLYGQYIGNMQGANEDVVKLLMEQMGTNLSLAQAMAQLGIDRASAPTWLQQMLGMGGQAASIYGAVK
jgi:hypothetical protein